jgi:hypothetical protein
LASEVIRLRGKLSNEDFSIAYFTKFNNREVWTIQTYRKTKEDAAHEAKRLMKLYRKAVVIPPGMTIEEVLGATE